MRHRTFLLAAALVGCTSVRYHARDQLLVREEKSWTGRIREGLGPVMPKAPEWAADPATRLLQECSYRTDLRAYERAEERFGRGLPFLDDSDRTAAVRQCLEDANRSASAENVVLRARVEETEAQSQKAREDAARETQQLRESYEKQLADQTAAHEKEQAAQASESEQRLAREAAKSEAREQQLRAEIAQLQQRMDDAHARSDRLTADTVSGLVRSTNEAGQRDAAAAERRERRNADTTGEAFKYAGDTAGKAFDAFGKAAKSLGDRPAPVASATATAHADGTSRADNDSRSQMASSTTERSTREETVRREPAVAPRRSAAPAAPGPLPASVSETPAEPRPAGPRCECPPETAATAAAKSDPACELPACGG